MKACVSYISSALQNEEEHCTVYELKTNLEDNCNITQRRGSKTRPTLSYSSRLPARDYVFKFQELQEELPHEVYSLRGIVSQECMQRCRKRSLVHKCYLERVCSEKRISGSCHRAHSNIERVERRLRYMFFGVNKLRYFG